VVNVKKIRLQSRVPSITLIFGGIAAGETHKFWATETLSENLFIYRKFSSKNAKFGTRNQFRENFKTQFNFLAPVISSVKNLQLFVGISSEICSACQKIATLPRVLFLSTTPLQMIFMWTTTTLIINRKSKHER